MQHGCNVRAWDELIPDALGIIFMKLPLQDVLTVVPQVCKSWRSAVMEPYIWQEIDIEDWSLTRHPTIVERMLHMLVPRSQGALRKLCATNVCSEEAIALIVNNAKNLHTLHLPRCEVGEPLMDRLAGIFCNITSLDISYCNYLGERALQTIGERCKNLTVLIRVMHPLDVLSAGSQDEEALAIAAFMPNLKRLEMRYTVVVTDSILEIIELCTHLELLDIRGCWQVELEKDFLQAYPRLTVVGPKVVNPYDGMDDGGWEASDNTDDNSWGEGQDDEDDAEDIDMWFYDGATNSDAEYEWPHSP